MNFPNKIEISNRVNLYVIQTEKFKTSSINVFIHRPLDENATKNALLPLILRRGCESFKTSKEISKYMEELYGAIFDCGVSKKGERHILRFNIESIFNEKFEKENSIFEKSLSFISEIISKPITENGIFKEEYINQEKDNLKRIIESRINEKAQYAMSRCVEEMCNQESYSIYEYGNVEDLDKINAQNLYEYYKEIISTSPIDIFVVGNVKENNTVELIKKYINLERKNIIEIPQTLISKKVESVKNIKEKMDVNQGKLFLGFRTNISYDEIKYYPLVLYSIILGGGLTSKLFINVREKHSLAYTINSRLDKFKGLMFIASGIDFDNYQKTLDIIFEQIEEMKNGNISDEEYNSAVNSITTSIRSLTDTHLYIVDFFLSQLISNSTHNFEQLIKKITSVKKEEIIDVSKSIELDTIYFLTNK